MSSDIAIYLSKQLLWHALLITSPVVLITLICGLGVSVLQVITQIQDSSLSSVPKILSVALALMIFGGWMLHSLVRFSQELIQAIPEVLR